MKYDETSAEGEAHSSSAFSRIIGYLSIGAATLSACLVILTLFMTGYSVFQRYILGTPLTWTDELSGFLVVAIVMLGVTETFRRGEHISVDLLSSKATGKRKILLDIWGCLATAFFAAVLLLSAWWAVEFSVLIGVYSDGYLEAPLWIPQSFLLIGAGLLLLLAIARTIDLIIKERRK